MDINIVNSADAFQRTVWEFWCDIAWDGMIVILKSVEFQNRTETTHWRAGLEWKAIHGYPSTITRPEVPESVIQLLKARLLDMVNNIKEVE